MDRLERSAYMRLYRVVQRNISNELVNVTCVYMDTDGLLWNGFEVVYSVN